MDSPFFLTIVAAAAIGFYFFMIFRKFRFHLENNEIDLSSSSSSSPPSPLSPSLVSPSNSSHKGIHDVFLSFGGEDVRREFLSHIHKEFQRTGITFIDNESKGGVFIGPEHIRAIRESKIAIIILSSHYASSNFCLNELVEVIKCREELNQTVIATFYKVDPSDVKKLTGDFGEVFRKTCVGESDEDTKRWRQALAKVATIAGYCSSNGDNDAAMIEKMATGVSNELIINAPSSDFDVLVGMGADMEKTQPFLHLKSDDVRMIGFWGPSGIGNITKLCYDQENVKIHHLGVAQDWLKDKRVFVVLDGVYLPAQLYAMANENGWLGPESTIIITTQDKKLLNDHGISHMCEVGLPPDDEAFQTFCMNDFGQKYSSSSSSSVPSSSSSHYWTHNIFPSFRGEDVRQDFLSHIHKEFRRKGITPFIDNEIKRGKSIGPELIRAIRRSKIAIILLSRNYASSKWCLNELVEIMKCREELGQTVKAVFYKVDPSDVKMLRGYFGKVFEKTCAGNTEEDIGRWRRALAKVATIASYHSSNWDDDAAMIEKIATDVSVELNNSAPSSDFDGLIGMGAHMEKLEPFLRLDSDEVIMIGIWGPSGIGKTTIARVLFREYSHGFQRSVFMENVKGNYSYKKKKKNYPGLCLNEHSAQLQLQQEFLSRITNDQDIKISHLGVAQERLKDMEVFAILDDVDQLGQLDAMAKETGWFGPGSRIIVTTQDKRLLKEHGINHIYEVQFPLFYEALQIFCMYAFRQRSPYDGFENLAWEVTELAGKLPLELKVIGSSFRGMSKHEWEKILPRLRTSLDGESESSLKFSYDALREEEKDIFLYIACLFNYEPAEKVEAHLATKFPDVRQGLHILSDKSIISISSGYVKMHDMLEKLGREIVRKQSICDPEQRRFLVNGRDTCDVLSNYTVGSRSVVGINSKYSDIKDELDRSCRAFEKMYTLQFLRLHGNDIHPRSYLPQSLKYLPRDIKLLHWECFPMTCLPSNFDPRFLIELNMSYSQLENLWEGFYVIRNLKWMDLKCSKNLKELPDLSTATSLKELNLEDCSSLVELPASLGNATNLEILNLSGCSNLKMLPSCIGNATNLRELFLRSCSSLVKLPSSIGNITCLKDLNLSGCSSLVTLPSSTGNIIGLKNLILSECSSLVKLPSSIGKITGLKNLVLSECSSLVELPSSIGHITGLHNLNVSNCLTLKELPSSIGNITNLEKLYLNGCSKLEALPNDINMVSLDVLDLADCSMLKTFPEISKNIRVLILNGTAIEEVPSSIKSWPRLDNLHMSYHENLNDFPHVFDIITELHLSDTGIQEIAPWVKQISRLRVLVIKGCTKLVSLPELPESLAFLNAENCESLERLHCSFHTIKFIGLNFVNCFKLNQEARDLIIKTSACRFSLFPGEKVPTYFTYRATGNSLSMKWNGIDTFPRSLSFKACVLLVNKGDVEVGDRKMVGVSYCLKEKHNGDNVNRRSRRYHHGSPLLKEHLYTFHVDVEVSSNEFFFDFEVYDKKWEIGESGLNLVPTL